MESKQHQGERFRMGWVWLIAGASVILTGCGDDPAPSPSKPRLVITVAAPEPSSSVSRSFSGVVRAAVGGGIAFEVAGRVTEVSAEEGMAVKAGELLAKVDPEDYQNQLDNVRAQLNEAEQAYGQTQQLFNIQNATRTQLDSAAARRDALRAQVASAEKKVRDCELRMPYTGIIGSVSIEVQEVVSAGQSVMTIQQDGGVEFETGVPANTVSQLSSGMAGFLTAGALRDQTWDATIVSIGAQVSDDTTYPVRFRVEGDAGGLRDGMDGEVLVELPSGAGDVFYLPSECVVGSAGGEPYVWVVVPDASKPGEGTIERRNVEIATGIGGGGTLGLKSGGATGVSTGDAVVARGVRSVEPGQRVRFEGN